jgi:hypothetical protein
MLFVVGIVVIGSIVALIWGLQTPKKEKPFLMYNNF